MTTRYVKTDYTECPYITAGKVYELSEGGVVSTDNGKSMIVTLMDFACIDGKSPWTECDKDGFKISDKQSESGAEKLNYHQIAAKLAASEQETKEARDRIAELESELKEFKPEPVGYHIDPDGDPERLVKFRKRMGGLVVVNIGDFNVLIIGPDGTFKRLKNCSSVPGLQADDQGRILEAE